MRGPGERLPELRLLDIKTLAFRVQLSSTVVHVQT
jgi:hypothetical protein